MQKIHFFHYPDFIDENGPTGYERTPLQPLEGGRVTVAAAVAGNGALSLQLSVDGVRQPTPAGRFVREENGRRFFEFELGGFPYGSRVEYFFEADGERSRSFGFEVCRETAVSSFRAISCENGTLSVDTGNPLLERFCLSFSGGGLVLSAVGRAGTGTLQAKGGAAVYTDTGSTCSVAVRAESGEIDVIGANGKPVMRGLRLALRHTARGLCGSTFRYAADSAAIYGLGERFNGVNQVGRRFGCSVMERFTNQGKSTYFPVPFYFCDGHGVFVDTLCRAEFDFGCDTPGQFSFGAQIGPGGFPDVHLLLGTPKEVLQSYSALTGRPALPPMWAFGLWISANRWNRQRHIEEQLEQAQAAGYPANVVVIEAWSDEATFYIWNDAQYEVKPGGEGFSAEDFSYSPDGRWPDPQAMINRLHALGMRLVLWQIPVLKELGAHEPLNMQHAEDVRYAVESGLCAKDANGEAYAIPDFWFSGSNLPDFTQQSVRDWWFAKRKYLLDMGVDGFKTDGGEFVFDDCTFANGSAEMEMKNGFVVSYLAAYAQFAGKGRTLFSRAGYTGSQRHPMHWAGDQKSTWQELRSVLSAGLSAGLSGEPFWGFDIGGFAGALPSAELYIRSTELASFAPVMQWHSVGMEAALNDGETGGVNDRSPWNIARATGDPAVLEHSLYYAWLHANLLPQIYFEAQKSALTGLPVMRHLVLEYPGDPQAAQAEDQFLLGDLLVAPVVEEGAQERYVYLPIGCWTDIWTGEELEGGRTILAGAPIGRIPLYLRHGGALVLRLGQELSCGRAFKPEDSRLCVLTAGVQGSATFHDENGIQHQIKWENGSFSVEPACDIGGILRKIS